MNPLPRYSRFSQILFNDRVTKEKTLLPRPPLRNINMTQFTQHACKFFYNVIQNLIGTKRSKNSNTVNQLYLTALRFSVLPLETYFVQENLAFFKSFPTVYNMPMLYTH